MEKKKIGILTCRKVGLTCTGAGCCKVLNERLKSFEQYADQEIELAAFFDCSGCEADKKSDPGFLKKMGRILQNNIEVVHLATCIMSDCPQLTEIKAALNENGIAFREGTH